MEQQTEQGQGLSPTAVIASRVRELRDGRGWSAERLADEMTKVGVQWQRNVVVKLETNRRERIGVDELLALAYVLGVAPMSLLLPADEAAPVAVTPTTTHRAGRVRLWVEGKLALPGTDLHRFLSEHGTETQGYSVTPRRRPDGGITMEVEYGGVLDGSDG